MVSAYYLLISVYKIQKTSLTEKKRFLVHIKQNLSCMLKHFFLNNDEELDVMNPFGIEQSRLPASIN
jgi:hypothetical protein